MALRGRFFPESRYTVCCSVSTPILRFPSFCSWSHSSCRGTVRSLALRRLLFVLPVCRCRVLSCGCRLVFLLRFFFLLALLFSHLLRTLLLTCFVSPPLLLFDQLPYRSCYVSCCCLSSLSSRPYQHFFRFISGDSTCSSIDAISRREKCCSVDRYSPGPCTKEGRLPNQKIKNVFFLKRK